MPRVHRGTLCQSRLLHSEDDDMHKPIKFIAEGKLWVVLNETYFFYNIQTLNGTWFNFALHEISLKTFSITKWNLGDR